MKSTNQKTFIYKKKSGVTIWPSLAFVAIAAICFFGQYGIAYRNFRLLSYPNSAYVAALIAIGFGAYYVLDKIKAKASDKNPCRIEMNDSGFSFNTKRGNVAIVYADVKQLWHREDSDGIAAIIYTKNNDRYEWLQEGFESPDDFTEFERILEKNCKNIDNRK